MWPLFTDPSVSCRERKKEKNCRTMRGGKRGWRTCGPRWWWDIKGWTKLRRVVQRQRAPFCNRCQILQMTYYTYMTYVYMYTYTYTYIHTFIYIYIYNVNIYTQVTCSRFKCCVCTILLDNTIFFEDRLSSNLSQKSVVRNSNVQKSL